MGSSKQHLFLVSAPHQRGLKIYAAALMDHLQSQAPDPEPLAMMLRLKFDGGPVRLAVIAEDVETLKDLLHLWGEGRDHPCVMEGVAADVALPEHALEALAERLQGADLEETAALWVMGCPVQWEDNPKTKPAPSPSWPPLPRGDAPHTLLDHNESTLEAQKWRKRITADMVWSRLIYHDQYRVFPGTALLEMARAACDLSSSEETPVLKDVTWLEPFMLRKSPLDLYIDLLPRWDAVVFKIYEWTGYREFRVYARGKVLLKSQVPEGPIHERLNLAGVVGRSGVPITGAAFHRSWREKGLEVSASFEIVKEVHFGENEALVRFNRPDTPPDCRLAPPLFEASLWVAAAMGPNRCYGLPIPFSLSRLEMIGDPKTVEAAHIRSHVAGGDLHYQITFCDQKGAPQILLRNLTLRTLEKNGAVSGVCRYFTPEWTRQDRSAVSGHPETVIVLDGKPDIVNRLRQQHGRVIFVEPAHNYGAVDETHYRIDPGNEDHYKRLFKELLERGARPDTVLHLLNRHQTPSFRGDDPAMARKSLQRNLERGLFTVFYIRRAVEDLKLKGRTRCVYAYSGDIRPAQQAVSGFGHSLADLGSCFQVTSCRLAGSISPDLLADWFYYELRTPGFQGGGEIRLSQDGREVKTWKAVKAADQVFQIKEEGVYLITGGGPGVALAEHLLRQYKVKVVLVLPGPLEHDLRTRLALLEAGGALTVHPEADPTQLDQVKALAQQIRDSHGVLNGVFHTWEPWDGALMEVWSRDHFDQVMWPKIQNAVNWDLVLASEELDFFMLFNSVSAWVGGAGQSLDVAADRFLDGYAVYREELRREGKRKGRTLSVNLPHWDAPVRGQYGHPALLPISDTAAGAVFEAALRTENTQMLAAYGRSRELEELFKFPYYRDWRAPAGYSEVSGWFRNEEEAAPLRGDVAVVGMGGRHPQSPDLDTFWENIERGENCVRETPLSRWDHSAVFGAHSVKDPPRYGGFIDHVDAFDAAFFHISPDQARIMDPEERLMLETVWETLEHAGHTRASMPRETGVFMGRTYRHYPLLANEALDPEAVASGPGALANRVSWHFNLQGPSMTVDAACASSITTLHLACESLKRNECAAALVGGVNLSLHPLKYAGLSYKGLLSNRNRSASLGDGDGFIPGEAVGVVMLKTLNAARLDGDCVYGVIKGSAVSHGGRTSNYGDGTADAQTDLIKKALKNAGVDGRTIRYIELSANGARKTDALEIESLSRVYGDCGGACHVGSLKANMGHLEAASGVSQLIKVLLQMGQHTIPPAIHANPVNPLIKLKDTPFHLPETAAPWPRPMEGETGELPRRAALNSFGSGGALGHLILEENTDRTRVPESGFQSHLFLFSAHSQGRLKLLIQKMVQWLELEGKPRLRDVAFTLAVGREAMPFRLAVVAVSASDLSDKLHNWLVDSGADQVVMGSGARNVDLCYMVEGPSGPAYLKTLLEERDLDRLARLWTAGACMDWAAIYGDQLKGGDVKRVALPTYPFERERYWLDQRPTPAQAAPEEPMPQETAPSQDPVLTDDSPEPSTPQQFLEVFQRELMDLASPAEQTVPVIAGTFNRMLNSGGDPQHPPLDDLEPVYGNASEEMPGRSDETQEEQGEEGPQARDYANHVPVGPALPAHFPLSHGQEALWNDPRQGGNLSIYFRLRPDADWELLQLALQIFHHRHPILGAVIQSVEGKTCILSNIHKKTPIYEEDCSLLGVREMEERIRRLSSQSINGEKGPLIRIYLLHGPALERVLLIVVHELIADEDSFAILTREVGQLYRCMMRGESLELPQIQSTYADYVSWRRRLADQSAEHLTWWRDILSKPPQQLDLAPGASEESETPANLGAHTFQLDNSLLYKLTGFARLRNGDLFSLLLAAFNILLHRYTGANEILVGAPHPGRFQPEFKQVFGRFADLHPLRSRLGDNPTFQEFLARTRIMAEEAAHHARFPFHGAMKMFRPPNGPPLFQAGFLFRDNDHDPGGKPQHSESFYERSVFSNRDSVWELGWLVLEISLGKTGNTARLEYRQDLFDRDAVGRMATHFKILLDNILAEPEAPINDLPILSEEEKLRLLLANNDTRTGEMSGKALLTRIQGQMKPGFGHAGAVKALADLKRDVRIHELFQLQADIRPGETAVIDDAGSATFSQLNHLANGMALQLVSLGVGPEAVVVTPTYLDQSVTACLLGAFKAGAAVAQLDYQQEPEQLARALTAVGASCAVVHNPQIPLLEKALAHLSHNKPRVLKLEDLGAQMVADNPPAQCLPQQTAFIHYHPETGRAVTLTQEGLTNAVYARVRDMKTNAQDRVLHDYSGPAHFPDALIIGGQTYAPSRATLDNPRNLIQEVQDRGVTVLDLHYPVLERVLDAATDSSILDALRWVVMRATHPPAPLIRRWLKLAPRTPISACCGVQAYMGPMTHEFSEEPPPSSARHMPAGYPVANTAVYILNERLRLSPYGFHGEICVTGSGLGRNVNGSSTATAEAFVPNPHGPPGSRMFKTGLTGMWLPNGKLQVLPGRETVESQSPDPEPPTPVRQQVYAPGSCLSAMGDQVQAQPDALALLGANTTSPFARMNRAGFDQASNHLAAGLAAEGVALETPVGICLEPSPEMAVAMTAVLKTGAHFLMLNPHESKERLFPAIIGAGCALVLASEQLADKVDTPKNRVLILDELLDADGKGCFHAPVHPENIAYLAHGKDAWGGFSAVMQSHKALFEKAEACGRTLELTMNDRVLIAPDPREESFQRILFATLCAGAAALFIAPARCERIEDVLKLARIFKVSVLYLPERLWRHWLHNPQTEPKPPGHLRVVVAGGVEPREWKQHEAAWVSTHQGQLRLAPADFQPVY